MAQRRPTSAVDAAAMRRGNAGLLLHLIWQASEISRADLARHTGLSPSTVSDIVGELLGRRLVRERGSGASSGGRRPTLLSLTEDVYQIVGVELGASHVTVVVTGLRGNLVTSRKRDNPTREEPERTLQTIGSLIEACLSDPSVHRDGLVGIGIAVPSPIDPREPGHLSRLILPAWADIDVRAELSARFELPVFAENDANAGALAEHWWGGHGEGQDLTFIKIATGIGAGYIIDGRLYRGAGGTAGEIGHLSIDSHGPQCICGLRGCLATLIGTDALLARARSAMAPDGSIELGLDGFVRAALAGDGAALGVVDELGDYLGIAVAGLLNLINPAVVVLGGGITALGDLLLDPLRQSMRQRALFTSVSRTRIVNSRLGENAIAIGSTALVLEVALGDLELFPPIRRESAA